MDSEKEKEEKVKKESPMSEEAEVISFSERPKFNFALLFVWLAAGIAIAAALFFWFADRSTKNTLLEKKKQKDEVIAQITSPVFVDVEKRAADFKSAVNQLSAAKSERYDTNTFLTEFYKRITNDVQIEAVSLADNQSLAFNGKTKSYRSVAELALALKSWPVLSDAAIGTVALETDENEQNYINFTFSAKINKEKALIETSKEAK